MIKLWMQVFLMTLVCVGLSACGTKGKLKTPSQIQQMEEKKARKAEKEASAEERQDAETTTQSNEAE